MAAFPNYVKFELAGFSESEDPSVLRTEMERGVPKERLVNSQVMAQMKGIITFFREEDVEAFDTWYFDTIKRIGWFTIRHPRRRITISARFIAGKRGDLVPVKGGFGIATRNIELEYLR